MRVEQYCQVLRDIALLSPTHRRALLRGGAVPRLAELLLGDSSPVRVLRKKGHDLGNVAAQPQFGCLVETLFLLMRSSDVSVTLVTTETSPEEELHCPPSQFPGEASPCSKVRCF